MVIGAATGLSKREADKLRGLLLTERESIEGGRASPDHNNV
jgi:hypothetical protein